jgi:hypothetical protein
MKNYFTFQVKPQNLVEYLRRSVYPANYENNRVTMNVKPGDIFWFWAKDEEKLYGPFTALTRMFEDTTPLDIEREDWTRWKHRISFGLWDRYIRVIEGPALSRLILELKKFKTTTDISHLGRIQNTLLLEEGEALLQFTLRFGKAVPPQELGFAINPIKPRPPLLLEGLLSGEKEAAIEGYLLQNTDALRQVAGDFTEVYNQLYAGERPIDILCINRTHTGQILNMKIIEIKTSSSKAEIEEGLEQLGRYMFWCYHSIPAGAMEGVLVTPSEGGMKRDSGKEVFFSSAKRLQNMYAMEFNLLWIVYDIKDKKLEFSPLLSWSSN